MSAATSHPTERDAIRYANTVKIDAMTLLGEFLKKGEKNPGTRLKGGGKGAGGPILEPPAIATFASLGISKKEASDAQQPGQDQKDGGSDD